MIKLGLISNNCPNRIDIGHEQENIVEQIQFDITAWVAAYGAGSASLVVQRAGDTSPYPVTVDLTDGIVTWTVSSTDTSVQGYGEIQLTYIVGEAVKKSAVMRFFCGRSLTGETPAPDPYEDWLQTLQEIAADAEGSASDASNSATEAAGSATAAAESAQDARAAADSIGDSVEQAQAASEQARASATLAAGYASDAQTAATGASASATSAEVSAGAAAEAVTAAQGYAQTASSAAESAETSASEAAASAAAVDGLAPLIEANRITDTASGSVASFPDGAGNVPMDHLIVSIEPVQEGSGTPSPDNVRPISGWTEVQAYVCGKNLFDKATAVVGKWLNVNTGAEEGTTSSYALSDYIPVKANQTYTMTNPQSSRRWLYDANKQPLSAVSATTFTPLEDGFVRITVGIVSVSLDTFQLELGSTATDYEPYSSDTYTTSLGQTVYGGTLDVVTGELVVDKAMVDMGTLSWSWYEDRRFDTGGAFRHVESALKASGYILSSAYECLPNTTLTTAFNRYGSSANNIATSNYIAIYFINSDYGSDATAFKNAMSGFQLVYELATPQTYTLTPTEVKTLLGANNVWADAGSVEVTYTANLKDYLAKIMA